MVTTLFVLRPHPVKLRFFRTSSFGVSIILFQQPSTAGFFAYGPLRGYEHKLVIHESMLWVELSFERAGLSQRRIAALWSPSWSFGQNLDLRHHAGQEARASTGRTLPSAAVRLPLLPMSVPQIHQGSTRMSEYASARRTVHPWQDHRTGLRFDKLLRNSVRIRYKFPLIASVRALVRASSRGFQEVRSPRREGWTVLSRNPNRRARPSAGTWAGSSGLVPKFLGNLRHVPSPELSTFFLQTHDLLKVDHSQSRV